MDHEPGSTPAGILHARGYRARMSEPSRSSRRTIYVVLMGTCVLLVVLAWNVVRLWSTTAAVGMSVLAAVLPPIAVIVANWKEDH